MSYPLKFNISHSKRHSVCTLNRAVQQDAAVRPMAPVLPLKQQRKEMGQELPNHELERLNIEYKFSDAFKQMIGGPPRFFSPLVPWMNQSVQNQVLPLLIYFPGVDGTCFAGYRQFARLVKDFDVTCLAIPNSDRTPFADLVAIAKEYMSLEAKNSPISRPIYVCGDSFGSLLAMAVAVECRDLVDRVILVNPASSFPRSWWKPLIPLIGLVPEDVYQYMPYMIIPFFGNMFGLTSHRINPNSNIIQQAQQQVQGMVEQLPELDTLKSLFPVESVLWKAQLVEEGCKFMEKIGYRKVMQRTLIVTANSDQVIPSGEEGERLRKILPRARVVNVAGRAHTILLEAGISLPSIIKEQGFYIDVRNMSSFSGNGVRKGNSYGLPGPVELPTDKELRHEIEGNGDLLSFKSTNRLTSPVYLSTSRDGRVSVGLEHVPESGPLLFVGNHQFMGLDMSAIIVKLLSERGLLVRGMAHPVLFADIDDKSREENQSIQIGDLFTSFGAVPNNPLNLYKLLQAGESVMLFPGGAVEGLKKQKYAYKLFWPQKAEFVRMASKFGATIVPFSAIGIDDSVVEILSSEDAGKVPFLGDYLRSLANNTANADPRSWQGSSKELSVEMLFPIFIPGVPARGYIKFGAPIETKKEWVSDKEMCEQVYLQTQSSVAHGLEYLQQKREQDPYKDFIPRMLFEASWGFKKQAPTFTP